MAVDTSTAIFSLAFMPYILDLQPATLPGSRDGRHQPMQTIRFRAEEIAANTRWAPLDSWLAAKFQLLVNPCAVEPARPEQETAIRQWAWRVLLLAAQLQRLARIPVFEPGTILHVQAAPEANGGWQVEAAIAQVAYFPAEEVRRCYEAAAIVVSGFIAHPTHFDDVEVLYQQLETTLIGPLCQRNPTDYTTFTLLATATAADVPWQHLGQGIYQLGWGRQALLVQYGGVAADSMLGVQVAGNKAITRRWLAAAGIPVPEQRLVGEENDAVRALLEIGAPVVIKPANSVGGKGVTVAVGTEAAARQAFRHALSVAPEVLVERQEAGITHHVQVVGGKVLFAMRRQPAAVIADGIHSIAELVTDENRRRQNEMLWNRLPPLPQDLAAQDCLARQGYAWDSTPCTGIPLFLRDIPSNIDGAHDEDVSHLIHPENVLLACRAAKRLGLAMAGVDLISRDISVPWYENGAVVNEVNHAPQLGGSALYQHYLPAMLLLLLPTGGRIPVEGYMGDGAALEVARHRRLDATTGFAAATPWARRQRPDMQHTTLHRLTGASQATLVLSIRIRQVPAPIAWQQLDDWLNAWFDTPFAEPAAEEPNTAMPADAPGADIRRLAWRIAAATTTLLRACGMPLFAAGTVLAIDKPRDRPQAWQCDLAFPRLDGLPADALIAACDSCTRWLQAVARQEVAGDPAEAFFDFLSQEAMPHLLQYAIAPPSTMALLRAATDQHIPWRHEGNGVFQLGWGMHARQVFTSRVDADSSIGIRAAGNKQLAAQWLRQAGLPTAEQRLVSSDQQAVAAAHALGWPLVVKPLDRDRGEGVSVNIRSEDRLLAALAKAGRFAARLLIERQAPGVCHRLLVVKGQVMYVVKRLPVAVLGDGVRNIQALIDAENQYYRNQPPWRRPPPLRADAETGACLLDTGWHLDSVPAAGEWVALRQIESTADGGRDEDMLRSAHADNLALAVQAAALFGLEVAGIDMITPDIAQPWYANGAIINEVNSAPALGASQSSLEAMPEVMGRLFRNRGRIAIEIFVGGEAAVVAARQRRDERVQDGLACYFTSATATENPCGHPHHLACATLYQRCLALLADRTVAGLMLAMTPEQWQLAELPLDAVERVEILGGD